MTLGLSVYYDFASPFCYIARSVVQRLRAAYPLTVDWLPFEVIDYLPPRGAMPQNPAFVRRAEARFTAQRAAEYALEVRLQDRLLNSNLALCAVEYAKVVEREHGPAGLSDRLHGDLFAAYYRDGEDIGSLAVVEAVAARAGLTTGLREALEDSLYGDDVARSRSSAQELGVVAVPTFLCSGYAVVGIPEFDAFHHLLQSAAGNPAGTASGSSTR